MTHATDTAQAAAEPHAEQGPLARTTILVFIALCVLTCASLLTYTDFWQQRVPLEIGRTVMMVVSVSKAFLVTAFFMHLGWESKWKYVVTIPAMCVSTLLCLSLIPDIGRRTVQYDNARWLNAAEPMPYAVGDRIEVAKQRRSDQEHSESTEHQ